VPKGHKTKPLHSLLSIQKLNKIIFYFGKTMTSTLQGEMPQNKSLELLYVHEGVQELSICITTTTCHTATESPCTPSCIKIYVPNYSISNFFLNNYE